MLENYSYINEPLYPEVELNEWEVELFNTSYVRRLKQLSHFGAGSLISPVVHSRYEHTIGVWKLTAFFFPNDNLARAATILHDIGHLPFSHSVERTLGFNHHELTEKYVKDWEIESILNKINLTSLEVIDFLNSQNQLTGTDEIMGLDHLDSFFRDTYMNGGIDRLPKDVLSSINCSKKGVIADCETALYIMELALMDHELFLSPHLLAADRILAEAISLNFEGTVDSAIAFLTDYELLNILNNSNNLIVKKLMNLLIRFPGKINIQSSITGDGISFGVRKVYNKTPMVTDGKKLNEDVKGKELLAKIGELKKEYELIIER